MDNITIENRTIGKDHPAFIIAELSANHLHDYDLAVRTIEAAKQSGVDAVKLQTYTPETMTLNCNNDYFQIKQGTIWDGSTLHQLYQKAYTPWDWHPKLQKLAKNLGLIFFSSPFDKTAVDFLEKIDVPAYKIASFEITDIPLIEYVAKKKKPMIVSTGIATQEDIELLLETCRKAGNKEIIILKCTSAYPSPLQDMNLNTITAMIQKYDKIIGLSDHTLNTTAPVAAVALGAKVIEKHLILDRNLGGPDSAFSLEPEEFKRLVDDIRSTEKLLGKSTFELTSKQKAARQLSRSLFVVCDTRKGDRITPENVRSIRPGFGLHPKHLPEIIGKRFTKSIKKGTPFSMDFIG